MSTLQRYQVNQLFLLIGKNPLPNYLAAMLLLAEAGTIYLIHTHSTEPQAERLKAVLKDGRAPHISDIKDIRLDQPEDRPQEIYDEIVDSVGNVAGKIGLHYTGGTKVMAIHAYRAVNSLPQAKQFSYLDADNLQMCIEDGGSLKFFTADINVDFSTLFSLHGITLNPKGQYRPSSTPRLSAVANAIAQEIFAQHQANQSLDTEEDFQKAKIDARLVAFRAAELLDADGKPLIDKIIEQGHFPTSHDAKQYADENSGHWLEDYLLQQIRDISTACNINDAGIDFPVLVGKKVSPANISMTFS